MLRYQNLLCRYDTRALKSLDIFSVHGFPVGQIQCESNLLGIINVNGTNVGSGGWTNIIDKYAKAKRYCDAPFEVQRHGSRNLRVPVPGEWIGERANGGRTRSIAIHCADATTVELEPNSLDAVFTDPPYFGNVQYGELMDFCYVWLRRLVGDEAEGFWRPSTRTAEELTGNVTRSRGLNQFTEGLAKVYRHMAAALKPGAPLAFTYHHNKIDAYFAIGVAILDAGLICSASLPCPAEMSGSIHIHGTSSSIVGTVFVWAMSPLSMDASCRKGSEPITLKYNQQVKRLSTFKGDIAFVCRDSGATSRRWLFDSADELVSIVAHEFAQIAEGGRKPTIGDTRCIIFGHLTRMAIWNLRKNWKTDLSTEDKLERFAESLRAFDDPEVLVKRLQRSTIQTRPSAGPLFSETSACERSQDVVPF